MRQITTKDLLLATKDKLAELELKLRDLQELTTISFDKNIEKARYVIQIHDELDKPELMCVIKWNDKTLKGRINNLYERRGWYVNGRESGLVLRDNNGRSYFDIDEYYPAILPDDQEEFRSKVDEILNDQFIVEFLKKNIYYPEKVEPEILSHVDIFPGFIDVNGANKTLFRLLPLDKKASFSDTSLEKKKITDEMLLELLNAPLRMNEFTKYQKNYIYSSPAIKKEISVSQFYAPNFFDKKEKNGEVNFRVSEDEKRLRLLKRF